MGGDFNEILYLKERSTGNFGFEVSKDFVDFLHNCAWIFLLLLRGGGISLG